MLAYAQMRQMRTIRTGELAGALRLSPQQEQEVIARLARGGLIARVRRGLYLVPPRLPLGGTWSPDPILALSTIMEDRGARYQICGPNAFNRYGFDEQVPARLVRVQQPPLGGPDDRYRGDDPHQGGGRPLRRH